MTSASLGKTLLVFDLLCFVLQCQICLLLQVSLDFLLLHSRPLWWKGHLLGVLVLEGLVGPHRTVQLQRLQCYWLGHRLRLLWYWMVCLGNEPEILFLRLHPSIALTKCGPLEKGMVSHFCILPSRTPWSVFVAWWSTVKKHEVNFLSRRSSLETTKLPFLTYLVPTLPSAGWSSQDGLSLCAPFPVTPCSVWTFFL